MANNYRELNITSIERENDVEELDFSDGESLSFQDLALDEDEQDDEEDFNPAMPGGKPTNDDMTPETLIKEDGAGSIHRAGGTKAADEQLTIVNENEIGAGKGLDEAELAQKNPTDKKW